MLLVMLRTHSKKWTEESSMAVSWGEHLRWSLFDEKFINFYVLPAEFKWLAMGDQHLLSAVEVDEEATIVVVVVGKYQAPFNVSPDSFNHFQQSIQWRIQIPLAGQHPSPSILQSFKEIWEGQSLTKQQQIISRQNFAHLKKSSPPITQLSIQRGKQMQLKAQAGN